MRVVTLTDAEILIPNKDHQNFTFNGAIISEGTVLEGKEEYIGGLRRGEPFTYRLFKTNKGQYIYLNKTKPMQVTEVTLGADSGQTKTVIDMIPAETYSKVKTISIIVGGIAGFMYSKYLKHDMKKNLMWAGVGAVVGYGAGYVLDSKKNVIVKPSK